jgi:hypothetical protein
MKGHNSINWNKRKKVIFSGEGRLYKQTANREKLQDVCYDKGIVTELETHITA